jgi:hypothetical protein
MLTFSGLQGFTSPEDTTLEETLSGKAIFTEGNIRFQKNVTSCKKDLNMEKEEDWKEGRVEISAHNCVHQTP